MIFFSIATCAIATCAIATRAIATYTRSTERQDNDLVYEMATLEPDGTLLTTNGRAVPKFDLTASMLVNKTTVIYGPSRTGKTVITKNIMHKLRHEIEQVVLVCPSEPANQQYRGIVDPPMIHYELGTPDPKGKKKSQSAVAADFLKTILDRQIAAKSVYNRANSLETLQSLFMRLPGSIRKVAVGHIEKLNAKRQQLVDSVRKHVSDIGSRDETVKNVNERYRSILSLVYKKFVEPAVTALWGCDDLTPDEIHALTYLHHNPKLLLIFDDCAADLKKVAETNEFRALFYRGRHYDVTTIVTCQDDTDIPANLRKNAFFSIFTAPQVCRANFERKSNQYSKETIQIVNDVCADVFGFGYHKIVYIRDDPSGVNIYHLEVSIPPAFRFGSTALHELCATVQNNGDSLDKDNSFYSRFITSATA